MSDAWSHGAPSTVDRVNRLPVLPPLRDVVSSIRPGRCRFGTVLAMLVALAVFTLACSNAGDLAASAGADARPTPAVVVPGAASAAPVKTGEVVGVTELSAGQTATDRDGNTISMYGWVPWPDSFGSMAGAAGEPALFGDVRVDQTTETLVAIDVEVCAPQTQAVGEELFRSRVSIVDDAASR